jgi:hypothetical protein
MDRRLGNASLQNVFFLPMLPEKKKKRKLLLPTGVSKSAAHTVTLCVTLCTN